MICSPTRVACVQDAVSLLKTSGSKWPDKLIRTGACVWKSHMCLSCYHCWGQNPSHQVNGSYSNWSKTWHQETGTEPLGMMDTKLCWNRVAYAKALTASDEVAWTPEEEESFDNLSIALKSPPTLGLPDCIGPVPKTVDDITVNAGDGGSTHRRTCSRLFIKPSLCGIRAESCDSNTWHCGYVNSTLLVLRAVLTKDLHINSLGWGGGGGWWTDTWLYRSSDWRTNGCAVYLCSLFVDARPWKNQKG